MLTRASGVDTGRLLPRPRQPGSCSLLPHELGSPKAQSHENGGFVGQRGAALGWLTQHPNTAAGKGRGPRNTAVTTESVLAWSPVTPLQPH